MIASASCRSVVAAVIKISRVNFSLQDQDLGKGCWRGKQITPLKVARGTSSARSLVAGGVVFRVLCDLCRHFVLHSDGGRTVLDPNCP